MSDYPQYCYSLAGANALIMNHQVLKGKYFRIEIGVDQMVGRVQRVYLEERPDPEGMYRYLGRLYQVKVSVTVEGKIGPTGTIFNIQLEDFLDNSEPAKLR